MATIAAGLTSVARPGSNSSVKARCTCNLARNACYGIGENTTKWASILQFHLGSFDMERAFLRVYAVSGPPSGAGDSEIGRLR